MLRIMYGIIIFMCSCMLLKHTQNPFWFGLLPVAVLIVYLGIKQMYDRHVEVKEMKQIAEKGKRYTGRVVDYRNGNRMIMYGSYPLDLVVRAEIDGNEELVVVETPSYYESDYYKGWYVDFGMLGHRAAVIVGSERKRLEDNN